MSWIQKNTSDAKPYCLYFHNFEYFSSKGPFASLREAVSALEQAGFCGSIYDRTTEYPIVSWDPITGKTWHQTVFAESVYEAA